MEVILPYNNTAQQTSRESRPLYHAQALPAPVSQQSTVSLDSIPSSDPYTLDNASSNVSQQTTLTDLTSASSPPLVAISQKPRDLTRANHDGRARTPEDKRTEFALASPMSLTSPVTVPSNGTKRTASGHVKNALSYGSITTSPRKARAESISSAGSRAGELAASLKTRLGYAMAKVQNGWEHKTIGELEKMTSQKMSPNNRYSMSYVETGMKPMLPSIDLNGAIYEQTSPPSKRRSGAFGAVPALQPAADIQPHSGQRKAQHRQMPSWSSGMSPPRTPVFPQTAQRPPTIRTNTQTAEAERDALQALTQLGSPHNSQYSRHHNASQASSSQASPLRSEFLPARKVSCARGDSDSSADSSMSGGVPAAYRR